MEKQNCQNNTAMKLLLFFLAIVPLWMLSACNNKTSPVTGKSDSTVVFGDSIPISNGLLGKVFLLPEATTVLPDFDTLKPQGNPIYLKQIDIPIQSWSAGFPGLRDRFEWFGIEYTGSFKPNKSGNYLFKLLSDDGSLLFIDDSLFINDDGIHGGWPVEGNIYLSDSVHSIKLRYFQGPRYELGLQLFWSLDGSPDKIFPGPGFVLQAPKPATHCWIWLLIILGVIMVAIGIIYRRKKNQKNNKLKNISSDINISNK
jgi:preprotein translocase subunit YajC